MCSSMHPMKSTFRAADPTGAPALTRDPAPRLRWGSSRLAGPCPPPNEVFSCRMSPRTGASDGRIGVEIPIFRRFCAWGFGGYSAVDRPGQPLGSRHGVQRGGGGGSDPGVPYSSPRLKELVGVPSPLLDSVGAIRLASPSSLIDSGGRAGRPVPSRQGRPSLFPSSSPARNQHLEPHYRVRRPG